jgi:inosine/xanthosine triphosphate pyrophosphatase family protein
LGQTVAEISAGQKNAISHRGRALRALGEKLSGLMSKPDPHGETFA